jgi:hypothetical protein
MYQPGTYQGKPSKTSEFITDIVRAQIEIGGIPMNVFRFVGVPDQSSDKTAQEPISVGELTLQDSVLMETRDRKYNLDEVPILFATYQVSQFELEYARFGAMLSNEAITLEVHVGSTEKQLGRRLIEGDVLELPHLKDISLAGNVQRKLFEVTKVVFSPSGYDPMWARHILGVVIRPLKHQQEFLQIMGMQDEYGKTLAEQNSNLDTLMKITEANQALAGDAVKTTGVDRSLMWVNAKDPDHTPQLFADSLTPPNGYVIVGQGSSFPANQPDGAWFIRTDMDPARLYRLSGQRWRVFSKDRKREWLPYNWVEQARGFMSDRSQADKNREYDLKNTADVLTPRESSSDPTYGGDRRSTTKTKT